LASKSKAANGSNQPKKVIGNVLPGFALKKVTPIYPAEARKARISGSVQVSVLISEEGQVIQAEIVDGPEELREASMDAAKQWVFIPTTLDGVTVKVQGILTFNFALQK
jgi:periplasmic protein TonB